MASLNRVTLVGNLAADPEKRLTKTGKTVCNFPIAVDRFVKLQNGERSKETDFHRITAWAKLGETVAQYLTKGRKVFVEGRLRNRTYNDKEGNKRYTTDIILANFLFMDSKGKKEEAATEAV